MQARDTSGWAGTYRIRVQPSGEEFVIPNRLTNAALNAMRDALYGDAVNLQITHIAVGDSPAAINDADTHLGNEVFRVAIASKQKSDTGVMEATAMLLDSDGPLTIREIGVFAGGTAAKDSGLMVSRILWTRDKTALETIQIGRTDTIRRV